MDNLTELKRLIDGIRFSSDPSDLENYGKDWSGVIPPAPSLVVFPASTEEVSRVLRACLKLKLPVVPSGGRTGLSGGAMAGKGEVVLSLTRMNQIGPLDLRGHTLYVEAGAVTEAVHRYSEEQGLTWPVDFASKGSSCVGGNIATNAGGVRVIRYGLTREWVLGLKVVLMNGEVLDLMSPLEKNNTGYDLKQLFIGSEGTLGVVTEAVLKLCPVPNQGKTRVCFFSLSDFSAVLDLFQEARHGPFLLSAFECLTDRCLGEVMKMGLRNPTNIPGAVYVLMEVEEESPELMETWIGTVFERESVLDGVMAQAPHEAKSLWAVREQVAEGIMRGGEVHQHDLSVPIGHLVDFASDLRSVYEKAYPDFESFIFGHIGDGNLHIFIRKPKAMASPDFHQACEGVDRVLFELTQKYGGSVSAEHGIGLLKKPALPYSRSAPEIEYFRAIKHVFDSEGLLNPGKII